MRTRFSRAFFAVLLPLALGHAGPAQGDVPGGPPGPPRIVYLLAGQSNIARLASSTPGCGAAGAVRSNVTYFRELAHPLGNGTFVLSPGVPLPLGPGPTGPVVLDPIFELGTRLGLQRPNDQIEIVMVAQSGSALLLVNQVPPFEFWVNSASWFDTTGLTFRMNPLLTSLGGASEFHIVWGQGETDALVGSSVSGNLSFEYEILAQFVFGMLALQAGHTTYSVHLVTIGAIESAAQSDKLVDHVRDAHANMQRAPLVVPPHVPSIEYAAHHYDLAHDLLAPGVFDPHHLSPCSYVTLARRIADGISFPAAQARVTGTGLGVPSGNTITIPVNVPLATYAATDSLLFEVIRNSAPAPVGMAFATILATPTSPPAVTVTFPTTVTVLSSDTISVRYVAGSGFADKWATTTVPIVAAPSPGVPARLLAPFFLSR